MIFGPEIVAKSADGETPAWSITRHQVSHNTSPTGLKFRIAVEGRHRVEEQRSEDAAKDRLAKILEGV